MLYQPIFKRIYPITLLLVALWLLPSVGTAQIERGGSPVGLHTLRSRGTIAIPTLRLPAFNQDSARIALENKGQNRLYFFAHPLPTDIDVIQQGQHLTVGGLNVWLFRVKSKGALSLNFLFDRCSLPAGGRIFIYSLDGRCSMGGFGPENISAEGLMPTLPIATDEAVIECQVPVGEPTPTLHVKTVNHGLRIAPARGPIYDGGWRDALRCAPDIACFSNLDPEARSVCMVCVNGVALGTGAIVRTAKEDAPYIITAAHVLTSNFKDSYPWNNWDYLPQTMVFFFNYKSPDCSGEVMPQVNQSVAGASLVGVDKGMDMAMVRLNNQLPASYRGYALGWTMEDSPLPPYYNIHHPQTLTMRINICNKPLVKASYTDNSYPFLKDKHWEVQGWDLGTTAGGSSGSPLLDKNKRYIGGLTGGLSTCANPHLKDHFFRLSELLTTTDPQGKKILSVLNPGGATMFMDGKELAPNGVQQQRITHIKGLEDKSILAEKVMSVDKTMTLMSSGNIKEIGELYQLSKGTKVVGFYAVFHCDPLLPGESLPEVNYTIYKGVGKQKVAQGVFPLKQMQAYNPPSQLVENIPRTTATFIEGYAELTVPLEMEQNTPLMVALDARHLKDKLLPVVQADNNVAGLHLLRNGSWQAAENNATLWLDLLVDRKEQGSPLENSWIRLTQIGDSFTVLINPPYESEPTTVTLYNLLGQLVYRHTTTTLIVSIPRIQLSGQGILVLKVQNGDASFTKKIYLPNNSPAIPKP